MITIFGVGPLMAAIRTWSPRSSRTRQSVYRRLGPYACETQRGARLRWCVFHSLGQNRKPPISNVSFRSAPRAATPVFLTRRQGITNQPLRQPASPFGLAWSEASVMTPQPGRAGERHPHWAQREMVCRRFQ